MRRTILLHNLRQQPDEEESVLFARAMRLLREHRVLPADAVCTVWRRSVDARRRGGGLHFVCSVAVSGEYPDSMDLSRFPVGSIAELREGNPVFSFGETPMMHRPVVVGSGPAGLFCSLLLAEQGYAPLLLERGGDVDERVAALDRFCRTRRLDPETNVQFGAGGAGTFSDGKLVTRVNDPLGSYVLRRLTEFGAPPDICTRARPHIGTDLLRLVVRNMIGAIRAAGGEVLFHTRLTGIRRSGDRVTAACTTAGDIPCGALVLAVGHSARDTYDFLLRDGYAIEAKPFSVGVRIEHLQADIDAAMYGEFAGHPALPHAEYNLSCNTDTRGVYTFCMCPGGQVVAAASEEGGLVVNGMSNYARDGRNANAAVAVSVFREDYGGTPREAIALQRQIERAAFAAGGADYGVPLCTVGDFLQGRIGQEPTRILPTYMGGQAYRLASPADYLPPFAVQGLREGIAAFGRRLRGFDAPDALLCGPETRTSAPVRILRDDRRRALGVSNLYPCGEGAGYAGGITSAALDGIHTALALMACYRPFNG